MLKCAWGSANRYNLYWFGLQEAIAIVLDVGPSMNNAPPGEETPLQTAVDAIKMIIQRKVVQ